MPSEALIGETTLPALNKLCHQLNFSGGTGSLLTLKFCGCAQCFENKVQRKIF
jgi:hypothetical protein